MAEPPPPPPPPYPPHIQQLKRCFIVAARGWMRAFGIGYSIRCFLSLFSAIVGRRLYRKPRKLIEASFLHKDTIGFALFLAFYSGGYKLVNGLLQIYRKRESKGINAAIAGATAGLSLLFFRSNEIAVYTFTRAIEAIYYSLVNKGVLPSYQYGDSVIFSLATAVIAYCLFTEPYAIKPVYQRFLHKATGQLDMPHLRAKWGSETAPLL
eukprot:Phypoly_transcript_08220.p1 GENE.Phypoly_transcript_08220~~Phypoly_transcript_08220.p1  ORF type:complete len:209 (-),score=13.77 Phypoly_transcript_08220:116-742(-)